MDTKDEAKDAQDMKRRMQDAGLRAGLGRSMLRRCKSGSLLPHSK
jgi:hypothetical protein